MKYTVTRERTYWVKETQIVEASSEEEAEEKFIDEWDPVLEIKGVHRYGGGGEFSTYIEVEETRT